MAMKQENILPANIVNLSEFVFIIPLNLYFF